MEIASRLPLKHDSLINFAAHQKTASETVIWNVLTK